MSIVLGGDGTITGLTATGISAVQQLPAGSVLQVVSASLSTSQSTTSTTYVTTNLTASITPKFATSKIVVIVTGSYYWGTGSGAAYFTLYRNSTNLEITSPRGFGEYNIPTAATGQAVAMSYQDNPTTTSSTAYTAYYRSNSGNPVVFCVDGSTATITLMEIAA